MKIYSMSADSVWNDLVKRTHRGVGHIVGGEAADRLLRSLPDERMPESDVDEIVKSIASERAEGALTIRVLVTGGRDFHDQGSVNRVLDQVITDFRGGLVLMHGAATGADACANAWAMAKRAAGAAVVIHRYHADWHKHGKAAGPLRNQRMIEEGKPDLVVAFPGGKGTADCALRAARAGIDVLIVPAAKVAGGAS